MRCPAWVLVGGVVLLAGHGCSGPAGPKPGPVAPPGPLAPTPYFSAGVRCPAVRPAAAASLPDDQEVVGVVVGDKARAYSLAGMSLPDRHLVNDLINDAPVTVTYCDKVDCLRVFTDDSRGQPLEVTQVGRYSDGLLLSYKGQMYAQATGKRAWEAEGPDLPLADQPFERMTWKAWRDRHPDTEVYTGPDGP
jgi:Protein of unknown function (DUF3179)